MLFPTRASLGIHTTLFGEWIIKQIFNLHVANICVINICFLDLDLSLKKAKAEYFMEFIR